MKVRSALVALCALAVAVLAGWGVGAAGNSCEHTCPAQGPCPTPADCLHQPFNWTGAIVIGLIVAVVLSGVALLVSRRSGTD